MDITAIPIKVETPTGDTLYRGETVFSMAQKRELLVKESKHGDAIEHFQQAVPDGKKWSVRLLLEITETNA